MSAVSPAAIAPPRTTPSTDALTNTGLVEQLLDLESWRGRCPGNIEGLTHAIDDVERRRIAVLDHAQEDGAAPVRANDVLLHRPAIMHLTDVFDENGGSIYDLERNVVQVGDLG